MGWERGDGTAVGSVLLGVAVGIGVSVLTSGAMAGPPTETACRPAGVTTTAVVARAADPSAGPRVSTVTVVSVRPQAAARCEAPAPPAAPTARAPAAPTPPGAPPRVAAPRAPASPRAPEARAPVPEAERVRAELERIRARLERLRARTGPDGSDAGHPLE